MPAPISAVKKGIKFESTLGTALSTNLKLENLTLSSSLAGASVNSVFIPPGSSTADLMNFNAGGVLITVNPSNQTTSKLVSLIEGKFVDLGLEFDGLGMFRFVVSPGNDQPTVSAWLPERTEHTIAVSYSTTTNILSVSIDGNSTQSIADFSSSDTSASLRVASSALPSPTDGTYDGFIGQLAFFKSEPSLSRLDIMTSNPDVLRTDFANVDLPSLSKSTNGSTASVDSKQEIQTVTVLGTNALATGASAVVATFLGASITGGITTADTPTTLAAKIAGLPVSAFTNAAPLVSITSLGPVLTLTYQSTADDVPETTSAVFSAATTTTGFTVSNATEFTKGSGQSLVQETQKVLLTGTTSDVGSVKFLGVDSASLAKNSTADTVISGILTNKDIILAGEVAKTLQLVGLSSNSNPGELILTFSNNAGNVSNVAASTTSNGISFSTGTETLSGSSGVSEKHIISLVGTYKTGDKIAITIPDSPPVTKVYDVKSSDSTTSILASSLAAAFGGQLGTYSVKASSLPEVQKVTISGPVNATGTISPITVLGASIPLVASESAISVAGKIASSTYFAQIKSANPNIDFITNPIGTADLLITYLPTAGDVAPLSPVAQVSGVSIAA